MPGASRMDGPWVFSSAGLTYYLGWGITPGSDASTGPRIAGVTAIPAVAWPAGSIALVNNAATGGEVWYNADGTASGWTRLSGASSGLTVTMTGTFNVSPAWFFISVALAAAAPAVLTLPPAADVVGQSFFFSRVSNSQPTQSVTIAPDGADTIDDAATATLIPGGQLHLYAVAPGFWQTLGSQQIITETVTQDPAQVNAQTVNTFDLTVNGVQTTDQVLAVNAPSLEANLAIGGAWVQAANTVRVRLVNPTGGNIDPASQDFTVTVQRPRGT